MSRALATPSVTTCSHPSDLAYVRDLGLVTRTRPAQIVNPIYQEVILRVPGQARRREHRHRPARLHRLRRTSGHRPDSPRVPGVLAANGEISAAKETYHESACQLVFMAWLHRIVNGGGIIDREYALGRKRMDICIRWPHRDESGLPTWQHAAVEIKVHRSGAADPLGEGLAQLDSYLDRLGLEAGEEVLESEHVGGVDR
jgi:hypothetical protein